MMEQERIFLSPRPGCKPRAAIFLSGSGTNAERLLEQEAAGRAAWETALLVTDAPETSRASRLAALFGKPLAALDIRQFYRDRGESRVSLLTEAGRSIREEWTAELRRLVRPFAPDFGLLAGFVPLTNLTDDFPCLNVHPGDLTLEDAGGRRILAGLHTVPLETAILAGLTTVRASVILAQTYSGAGGEMDSGSVLGVSPVIPVELGEHTLAELRAIRQARLQPRGDDALSRLASAHQERLKVYGDWVVFPAVVNDFAAGCFGMRGKQLLWRPESDAPWTAVRTVAYDARGGRVPAAIAAGEK